MCYTTILSIDDDDDGDGENNWRCSLTEVSPVLLLGTVAEPLVRVLPAV